MKNKKRNIKMKINKQGSKLPTTIGHVEGDQLAHVNHTGSVDDIDKPTKTTHKHRFPCKICKGDKLLKHFLGIPKFLELWSMFSQQPISLAVAIHTSDNPSTSDSKVGSKKGSIKFPCRLCEGSHQSYLFLHMDSDSHFLKNIVDVQQQIPTNYLKISPNPPLVDELVNLVPSSVNPVDQVINLIPSSFDPTLPLKSDVDIDKVFILTIDSSRQEGTSPVRNPLQAMR
jgi:hypothetical protein